MDTAMERSRETDPISQLEARTASYAGRKRIYLECTVSYTTGRIWTEYTGGTESRIVVRCVHCGAWQRPERDQLKGWQDVEDEYSAEDSMFVCGECSREWSAIERQRMNVQSRLLSRGQEITPDGDVTGEAPKTRTFGFRWDGFNNLFWSAGYIAHKEYLASQELHDESVERELRQFYWAVPCDPERINSVNLDIAALKKRNGAYPRGVIPKEAQTVSMGVDIGKHAGHWSLLAVLGNETTYLVDYGIFDVPGEAMPVDKAIEKGLTMFMEQRWLAGWQREESSAVEYPLVVFVDAGYEKESVFRTLSGFRASDQVNQVSQWYPAFGRGQSQMKSVELEQLQKTGKVVLEGEDWRLAMNPSYGCPYMLVNSDHWKSRVHKRLACEKDADGAFIFPATGNKNEHRTYIAHLTAEKVVQERNSVGQWVEIWSNPGHRQNHFFDSCYNGFTAADFARIVQGASAAETPVADQLAHYQG